ncbi:MAG: DNA/RNA non-specific endonuclease [Bacteroidota bacterium]
MRNLPDYLNLQTAAAFVLGVFLHWLWNKYLWPYRHKVYTWIFTKRNYDRLGDICKTDKELSRNGYSLGYSYRYKAPLWVSYIISRASKNIDWERNGDYEEDLDLPEAHRLQPSDFTNTGYDKGHMAPSSAIDFSAKTNRETFLMSNITLQHPQLNRQVWRALENQVQDWVQERGRVFVVTGPLYGERLSRINGIPIPRTFYKVIYSPKHVRGIAFLFPNKAIKSSKLWDHVLAVSELEELCGYDFFHKFSKRKKRLAKELDLNWWKEPFEE